ncbi:type II toxin-antitoxin system RelE/ParE family toxin [bacterium]|nr:type II toxin-antitoxin system RelE/ParE family toxin [bacterium]
MNLVVLSPAELEASEAALWYEEQRSHLGDEFLIEMMSAFDRITRNPDQYPKLLPGIAGRDLRVCLLRRFPYSVIFECQSEELIVVAISHGRREPLYGLDRID